MIIKHPSPHVARCRHAHTDTRVAASSARPRSVTLTRNGKVELRAKKKKRDRNERRPRIRFFLRRLVPVLVPVRASPVPRKKERKQTAQGRDGRTARRHHTGILRRGVWCASRRPPWGVCLFVSLFAVSRRFSLQPSCHLAAVPLSSFSPLSPPPLSRHSLLPRPAPPPPAVPLFSRLLSTHA